MSTTATNRKYYLKNREKIISRSREWYQNNKERHHSTGKAWATRNKKKIRLYQASKYLKNRDHIRAKTKEYKRIERLRNAQFLADYKLARGCVDCGYKENVYALEFDHVQPQRWSIANLLGNSKRLHSELELCEVVCSNCHSIRTQTRRRKGTN